MIKIKPKNIFNFISGIATLNNVTYRQYNENAADIHLIIFLGVPSQILILDSRSYFIEIIFKFAHLKTTPYLNLNIKNGHEFFFHSRCMFSKFHEQKIYLPFTTIPFAEKYLTAPG